MCPIVLPDRDAEWRTAIDECIAMYGEGNFCALDVQKWIDTKARIAEQIERWAGVLEYLKDR
ncbi:hypothetical protein J4U00_gp002 [Mycobacterium phage DyoEdafos]|uniref:Uncharacterized protein n=1 Tax=Mycobacterium phage DyoEdafos TaxID=2599860 RepID=A0A5J6THQ1_9CAUD|nr:hypothetical protein J4U00_gp002 [Mycobacterium phage DyoEdafos]QFG10235.1 hypothetical protein SEA_DYOEDAFOS_2 [Mycobacterium phage DyoEdafos]